MVPNQANMPQGAQNKWKRKVANRNESKIERNKQTNLAAEVARTAATAAVENKKRKKEFELRKVSEEAAAKVKNDYIEFIKNGVLSGSIKSILPDSGASSSTAQSATNYVETGQKSTKEFQSAFGEVQKATDIVEYLFKLREEAR